MSVFKLLFKEPIIHFVIAGALLYSAVVWVRGPDLFPANDNEITVDREALLTFLQFRSNAFDQAAFENALDAMPEYELQELIDSYLDEEVLYREARALNLDDSDYIIRQRMVQKMQFLLSDLAGGEVRFTEDELQSYFERHKEAWLVVASATFTHVFFDPAKRGNEQAYNDALALKEDFNARNVGFNDANGEGDRFPFLRNYVERTFDYLKGQFGEDFVLALEPLSASPQWQGPFKSAYGWHIILLNASSVERYPDLSEVRKDVERDFMRERSDEVLTEITQSVRERYQVNNTVLTGPSN